MTSSSIPEVKIMFCNLNERQGIGGSFNDFIVVTLLTLLFFSLAGWGISSLCQGHSE